MANRRVLAMAFGGSLVACSSSPPSPAVLAVTLTSPPVGEGLTDAGLSLPVGTVAEIDVCPTDDGGDIDGSVSARADDSTYAVLAAMTTPNQFVVIGVAPGDTTVRFFFNGQETTSLTIDGTPANVLAVEVVPQTAPR